ncbi:MAG TPA: MFS transporter [Burkholderiaceae bacterium]|nr:MFS transporter [Burkholderiaceae bacterium]
MNTAPINASTNSRRNTYVLSAMQALGGTNPAIVIAVGGLAGQQLASRPELSTVPISLFHLGLALGTIPAAMIMRRHGRRTGYVGGTLLGALGGLIAALGIYSNQFAVFCLGTILAGLYASYVQSYRFAAADSADDAFRPKAISWVMAGGLVAAFIATQAVILTRDIGITAPYAATFLALAGLSLLAVPLAMTLRIRHVRPATNQLQAGRPLRQIARSPYFVIAVLTGVVSYGLMTLIMTATPLAMHSCGHSLRDSTLGIQWHILAMYGPSFFTGDLIKRFGKITISLIGIIMIAVASAIALHGISIAHFWFALIMLGVGWNFGFIGATTMVTDCYRPEEKNRVQAVNDFLIFGSVAVASFSSGHLLAAEGWETLNLLVFPATGIIALALVWLALQQRRLAVRHAN